MLIAVHVMLKNSRWGLRTRAIGEHPKAADTVGINVNRMRFTQQPDRRLPSAVWPAST